MKCYSVRFRLQDLDVQEGVSHLAFAIWNGRTPRGKSSGHRNLGFRSILVP